jgi:hypothetical protein
MNMQRFLILSTLSGILGLSTNTLAQPQDAGERANNGSQQAVEAAGLKMQALEKSTKYCGHQLPTGTELLLGPRGCPVEAILGDSTTIAGLRFPAHTRLLFTENGKLRRADLTSDTTVSGVPFKGGTPLVFDENQQLESGILAKDVHLKHLQGPLGPVLAGSDVSMVLASKAPVLQSHGTLPFAASTRVFFCLGFTKRDNTSVCEGELSQPVRLHAKEQFGVAAGSRMSFGRNAVGDSILMIGKCGFYTSQYVEECKRK